MKALFNYFLFLYFFFIDELKIFLDAGTITYVVYAFYETRSLKWYLLIENNS